MSRDKIDKESHERLTKTLEGLFASGSISYQPTLTSVHVETHPDGVALTARLLGLSSVYGARVHRSLDISEEGLVLKAEALVIDFLTYHFYPTLGN